jgi:hypothetical protein
VSLPTIPSITLIAERLPEIFPQGTENRNYVIREMAARTVYVMLYADAIDGKDRWIRPSHIYFMTQEQAANVDDAERAEWFRLSIKPGYRPLGTRWYADTTREPVRDETLRSGFIVCRAVIERDGVPTTSSIPKYALDRDFAALFDSDLENATLASAITAWRASHLSKAALTRQHLVKQGASAAAKSAIPVTFPNGETRTLTAGPSSVITKAVIEQFAPRFLKQPTVLWLSESGNKVVARDEALASALKLKIDASRALPDIILVDLCADSGGHEILVVFIEVVATDGPINRERKAVLTDLAVKAGFDEKHLAFLTAYLDRAGSPFKKNVPELAWGSYAWFVSEPDHIIRLYDGKPEKLSERKLDA